MTTSPLRPGDSEPSEPLVDADVEPELAALLERTALTLGDPPDDLTTQRHLRAIHVEVARGTRRGHVAMRFAGVAAAALVAVVATLGGLGALPAPAQQVMSDVARQVGLRLPAPAMDAPGVSRAPGLTKRFADLGTSPGGAGSDRLHPLGGAPKGAQNGQPGPPSEVPGRGQPGGPDRDGGQTPNGPTVERRTDPDRVPDNERSSPPKTERPRDSGHVEAPGLNGDAPGRPPAPPPDRPGSSEPRTDTPPANGPAGPMGSTSPPSGAPEDAPSTADPNTDPPSPGPPVTPEHPATPDGPSTLDGSEANGAGLEDDVVPSR